MKRLVLVVALAVAAMGVGCQQTPPPAGPVATSPLVPPLRPGGMAPTPAGFDTADMLYLRGALAFHIGDYADAAPWLAGVAETLPPPPANGPYRAELAANRLIAYRNATIAWLFAGNPDEARKMLDAALDRDPECEAGLREIRTMLPPKTE